MNYGRLSNAIFQCYSQFYAHIQEDPRSYALDVISLSSMVGFVVTRVLICTIPTMNMFGIGSSLWRRTAYSVIINHRGGSPYFGRCCHALSAMSPFRLSSSCTRTRFFCGYDIRLHVSGGVLGWYPCAFEHDLSRSVWSPRSSITKSMPSQNLETELVDVRLIP